MRRCQSLRHRSYVAYLLRELEHFYDLGMVDPMKPSRSLSALSFATSLSSSSSVMSASKRKVSLRIPHASQVIILLCT